MSQKTLLFSLTRSDFEFQTFCTGGNGGQHRNAKQNGVRCIHPASGARGEHRDGRDQFINRREAFRKCCESPAFMAWHKVEVSRRLGKSLEPKAPDYLVSAAVRREIDARVDAMMAPENLRIDYIS